jgi:hypothetical protein
MVANFSNEKLTIPKATVLGVAEKITEKLADTINAGDKPKSSLLDNQQRKKRNVALYRKLLQGKLDHLGRQYISIQRFRHLISRSQPWPPHEGKIYGRELYISFFIHHKFHMHWP